MPKLGAPKTGLVLCGGGFKGGYQIGAWKALREKGISEFAIIAGTSVGALNSVLIANQDIPAAEHLWRDIDVMKWKPRGLVTYAAAYVLLFGPLACTWALLLASLLALLCSSGPLVAPLFGASLFLAVCAFWQGGVVRISALWGNPFFILDPRKYQLVSLGSSMLPICIALSLVPGATADQTKVQGSLGVLLCGFVGALVAGIGAAWVGSVLLKRLRLSGQLFASDGLEKALMTSLDLEKMKANAKHVFATLAEERTGLDPFTRNIHTDRDGPGPGIRHSVDFEHPPLSTSWVPHYVDICTYSDPPAAAAQLRLSGALPWVFQSGSHAGGAVVDGGLIDNMPILPVAQTDVERIVIIMLSPNDGLTRERLQATINSLWRDKHVADLSDEEIVKIYQKWVRHEPTEAIPAAPSLKGKEILIFAPQKPLATWSRFPFLTGTLNFSREAKEKWLDLGYRETLEAFEQARLPE